MYFFFALLLGALAVLLLWLSGRQRRGLGLPQGRVVYSDTGAERKLESPLFDDDLFLVGRPDYLVENEQGLIPVEVKSGRTPTKPYDTHVFQLAAYCVLVESTYLRRPAYGIIRYPERSFQIEFTRELETKLRKLLGEMREGLWSSELHRSHSAAGRCRSCGFNDMCTERI